MANVVIRVTNRNGTLVQAPGTNAAITNTTITVTNLDAAILRNDKGPQVASQITNFSQYLTVYSNTALMLANDATTYANAVTFTTSQGYITAAALAGYQTSAGLAANVLNLTSNNSNFLGGVSLSTINTEITGNASSAYTNAVSYVVAQNFVNTSQLSSNLSAYQTSSGLSSNVLVLTSNAANYLGNSSGTLANVASWITGNAATAYANAVANAAALYQTTAGLSSNVATLTANTAGFLGNSSGTLANISSWVTGNAATAYANAIANAASNAAGIYQTSSGLSSNVLVLTSNAAGFLGNSSGTLANVASWITGNAATAYSNAVANAAALYQTTAGLSANVAVLAANSATYLGNSSGTITNVSSWITGNAASAYANATANAAALYQTTAGLSANVAVLTSNAATYLGNSSGTLANISSWVTGNAAAAYANAIANAASNAAGIYQTSTGLSANIAAYLTTYTGVVNGSSFNIGTNAVVNSTIFFIGNTTVNSIANATTIKIADGSGNTFTINSSSANVGNGTYYNLYNSVGIGRATTNGYPFIFSYAGSNNASNSFWNGYHFTPGPGLFTNSTPSNVFPRLSQYYSYTNVTNPTDLYWNIVAGNDTGLGTGIRIRANSPTSTLSGIDISSNGNVGVATTAPAYKLDVTGDIRVTANLYANNGLFTNSVNATSYTVGTTFTANATNMLIGGTGTSNGVNANTTTLFVGNNSVSVTINATSFSGTSNNSTNFGGLSLTTIQTQITGNAAIAYANAAAASDPLGSAATAYSNAVANAAALYQTTAGLSANVATLTANNSTYLGGVVSTSYVNTSGAYTITGMHTHSNGITFSNTITANGSNGTSGQVLTSSGATGNVYWSTVTSGGVNTAAQYTFSNTITFTSSVLANTVNVTTLSVGTGVVANSSGFFTNAGFASTLNGQKITFTPLAGGSNVYFAQQNDDNFVFYTTNTTNGTRAVWSIFANSITSSFSVSTPAVFNANITIGALIANGSIGTLNQVLTSNGTGAFWSSPGAASVNTAAQYTWSNTQTFSANISFTGNNISVVNGAGSIQFNGAADTNWRIGRNTSSPTKYVYTNNTLDFLSGGSNLEGFTFGAPAVNTYLEIGSSGTFTKNPIYVGNATVNVTINSTSFSGTSNNSTNFGGLSLATIQTQITGNAATAYANAVANAAGIYQTTAGLSSNVLVLTSNAAGFLGNSSGTLANVASWITGNAATAYANAIANAASNAAGIYQTTAGLSANVLTLTANNSNYLGTIAAASYVQNTDSRVLSGNLNFTGVNNFFSSAIYIGANVYVNTTSYFVGNSTANIAIGYSTVAGDASLLQAQGNANTSTELSIANFSIAGNGSADFIAYDSLGLVSNNYIDVGINSNTFSTVAWTINGPSDAYVYSSNTNLSIGSAGNGYINFFSGGLLAANEKMRITPGGNVGIGNTAPDATLKVTGTANVSGNVVIGGSLNAANVTASLFTGNVTGTASNATNLNSQPGSYYTNATNITTGTLPFAQLPANVVNTSAAFTITGMYTFSNGITFSNTITANGSNGTAGYVLTSSGATGNVYWAAASAGVNTAAQYSWSNTQTFSSNVTFSSFILGNNIQASNGFISLGSYNNTFSHGIVMDYVTGMGRISVGPADGITFYNGNVATTATMTISNTGNVGIGNTVPATMLQIGGNYGVIAQTIASTNAISVNCASGNYFIATANGSATTITFTSVPANTVYAMVIRLANGGVNTFTWSSSPKWPSGSAPTVSSNTDIFTFVTENGGTTWYGVQSMIDVR